MMRFLLCLLLLPSVVFASVAGMDDVNPNISPETQQRLDDAITTYYQHPSREKVETVLDIMNHSHLLEKKTAWAPMVGFLTVVFANNKNHIFDWMSRNDYNAYAQDVIVAALQHAKLREAALVFAQAHQWKKFEIAQLRSNYDSVDLKHLTVLVPGHIDTLWGAFFASGDPVYVSEIIQVLFETETPVSESDMQTLPSNSLEENKKLAETTLRQYAPLYAPVENALEAQTTVEPDEIKKNIMESITGRYPKGLPGGNFIIVMNIILLIALLMAAMKAVKRQRNIA